MSTLMKDDGNWCKLVEEIEGVISGYFKELFIFTNPKLSDEILDGIP